jgi:selenocysteine lyase/cysteine desulfurase
MAKSLKVLDLIGMDNIAAHEAELTSYALEKLNQVKGVTVFGQSDPKTASTRLGVIPFKIGNLPNGKVAAILSTEFGIGVRNGCFCAHPYVTYLMNMPENEIEKFRTEVLDGDRRNMPGVVRISFGMYNTTEEIDYATAAISTIAKAKYEGSYRQEKSTGEYFAVGWEPDLSRFFSL